jgi:hypothetical protein
MDEKIARLEIFWVESTDLEDRKEQKSEPESEKLTPVDSNLEPEKPNEAEGEGVDAKEGMALFGIEEITFSKLFELYFDENRLLEIVGQFRCGESFYLAGHEILLCSHRDDLRARRIQQLRDQSS